MIGWFTTELPNEELRYIVLTQKNYCEFCASDFIQIYHLSNTTNNLFPAKQSVVQISMHLYMQS